MGKVLGKIMKKLSDDGPKRILMLGLDNAGKTTILYRMKNTGDFNTVPTVGFNVEAISPCRGITLTVWDVGGQDKLRSLWHHYLNNIDGFVFVIDSTDHHRLGIAKAELIGIYQYESMKNIPLVVIVNKQDSPDAMTVDVIAEKLDLKRLTNSLHYVTPCCALSGDGLTDAFSMLAKLIRKQTKKNRLAVM